MTKDDKKFDKKRLTKDEKKIYDDVHSRPDLTLFIARVPPKTKAEFIAWANEDFLGDYGFALKALWDAHKMIKETEEAIKKMEDQEDGA